VPVCCVCALPEDTNAAVKVFVMCVCNDQICVWSLVERPAWQRKIDDLLTSVVCIHLDYLWTDISAINQALLISISHTCFALIHPSFMHASVSFICTVTDMSADMLN